ncbi:MAG: DNA mismatch repair endonuclease MutL [Faecalibacterium sp.]
MAKIHVLEKHIAELIAAGEVVERPAAVVKELLENAIDAGAGQITVAIESGGIQLIEIVDNGTGIEAEFIDVAFIRHATSKIQSEDDLNRIATLGFRGEALASIASVAKVEVLTKTEEDEFACSYRIEGGQPLGLEISARAVGTTIRVKDLFYNTPARMKFLKKDASEGTFVADLVAHVALSHPEIRFKFIREGKLQYVTPGDGDLQSAAYAVLGREFARDLVKVEGASECYTISGYVSPPKNCRASRSMQYFYINGRYVKNRTMMAALEAAYKGTLMHGKFPGAVLSVQMPHDMIDVNVHPAKTEVRFAREKDVFEAVYRAVKGALSDNAGDTRMLHLQGAVARTQGGVASAVPVATPGATRPVVPNHVVSATAPILPRAQMHSAFADAPAKGLEAIYQAEVGDIVGMTPSFVPVKGSNTLLEDIGLPEEEEEGADLGENWEGAADYIVQAPLMDLPTTPDGLVQSAVQMSVPEPVTPMPRIEDTVVCAQNVAAPVLEATTESIPEAPEQTSLYPVEEAVPLVYIGEVFKTYIITEQADTICLIDKHAAHERMLYETLQASYGNVASQMLLEAVAVNLSAAEKQALLENIDLLEQAGLEIDDFGGMTVLVRAVPADVVVTDVTNLVVELAAKLANGSRDAMNEKTEWVLHSISCRAAIKAGDKSDAQQLVHLAQRILSGEIPPYCPHGRPCIITLTRKELEKQFGRIV